MQRLRLLVVLGFVAMPLAASAGRDPDLEDFFPGLVAEIAANFAPVVVIEGGPDPGTFPADAGEFIDGLFDPTEALGNVSQEISSQIQRVPHGSTVAAFTFEFDSNLNVFTRSTEGLGPLASERAQTTGKGKLNVAFSHSYVDFKVFEGDDLDDIGVSFGGTAPFTALGATGDGDYSYLDWGLMLTATQPLWSYRSIGAVQLVNGFSHAFSARGVPNQGQYSLGGSRSIRGVGVEKEIGRNILLVRAELRQAGFDPWFIEKRRGHVRVRVASAAVV